MGMKEETKQKIKASARWLASSWQTYVLAAVLFGMCWMLVRMLMLQLFPASTILLFFGLGLILLFIAGWLLFCRPGWKGKIAAVLACVLIIMGCYTGQQAAGILAGALHKIAQPNRAITRQAVIYTYAQVPVRDMENLNGQTLGVLETRNTDLNNAMLADLEQQGISVRTKGYFSLQAMIKALKGQAIRAVVLSPADLELIEEFSGMEKARQELSPVYAFNIETGISTPVSDLDLDRDCYTVLISGSSDPISQTSYRSSMNVLLSVNPKTSTMLLTFVPRSSWVNYQCDEALGCPAGTHDKAGFASMYTIETLRRTLEFELDIPIDFTVRVDLNTLLALSDMAGGIRVQNDEEYTNGYFSFAQGEIEMDSPRARRYIGELNDFSSSDQAQEKHQLNVLLALLRLARQADLTKMRPMLDIIDDSVRTSFTYTQICQLTRQLFLSQSVWSELFYSLSGGEGLDLSGSLTEYAYAYYLDPNSIARAHAAIEAVYAGQQPDVTPIQSEQPDAPADPEAASPDAQDPAALPQENNPAQSPESEAGLEGQPEAGAESGFDESAGWYN